VHELLRDEPAVRASVVERLGERVFGSGGAIDRGRLADVVFAEPAELEWLERLLHPRVMAELAAWRAGLAAGEDAPLLCVAEVPLLYEIGAERDFDAVVVVTAPAALRARRLGHTPAEREQRLLEEEEKLARADFAFINDGDLEELDRFVSGVVAKLT
jgi:dephospho-CoA kinase